MDRSSPGSSTRTHRARAIDIGERLAVLKDYPTPSPVQPVRPVARRRPAALPVRLALVEILHRSACHDADRPNLHQCLTVKPAYPFAAAHHLGDQTGANGRCSSAVSGSPSAPQGVPDVDRPDAVVPRARSRLDRLHDPAKIVTELAITSRWAVTAPRHSPSCAPNPPCSARWPPTPPCPAHRPTRHGRAGPRSPRRGSKRIWRRTTRHRNRDTQKLAISEGFIDKLCALGDPESVRTVLGRHLDAGRRRSSSPRCGDRFRTGTGRRGADGTKLTGDARLQAKAESSPCSCA